MSLRCSVPALTLLVAALVAPSSPAGAANGLSTASARQLATQYAAELCAAYEPECQGYKIPGCARLGPKKVKCTIRLDYTKGETCRYQIKVTKKPSGKVEGKLSEASCS